MRKKRVYVAGKLNADAVGYLYNVHKMMNTAEVLRESGYSVFIPALDLLMGIAFGWTDYHTYFDNNQPWLEASDAVYLVPGWETSSGTRKEMEMAFYADIPVFDDMVEMENYFNGKSKTGKIIGITYEADGNVVGPLKDLGNVNSGK